MKTVDLADENVVKDLRIFFERLMQSSSGEVRVVAEQGRVSIFSSTLYPAGLSDPTPLILVHRGFAATVASPFDIVVETRALLDRMPRITEPPFTLPMPPTELTAVWAGVLPPRTGWDAAGQVDTDSLVRVARAGADRVNELLPADPGQLLVDRARKEVWSLEMLPGVPAGAAFALDTMGFLDDQKHLRLQRSRAWLRLASQFGDVFVRT